MANNIKGITIEIGGDTSPLDKALKGVNKTSRDLQSELREVNRQLKLDPTNTTLLTQKQELLSQTITTTRGKLQTLKEAEKQVEEQFQQGKIGEEKYRAFQREVIATEQKLESLEKRVTSTNAAFAKVTGTTDKVSEASSKVAGKMMPATLAIAGAGAAAIKVSSDYSESLNKVEVAFGNNAKQVEQWSKTTIDKFGIAGGTALDMASLYGDMGTSMGFAQDKAANMATSLVGLSGDLASFKNIGIEEAKTALNGVFTGETESLKRLGVVMTEQNLLQYAVSKGMVKNKADALEVQKAALEHEKAQKAVNEAVKKYGDNSVQARDAKLKLSEVEQKTNETAKVSLDTLSQQEKVQLRYNYVMDMTKNAQGDFARTSSGTANSSRVLGESVKELATTFGQSLLPIITPIIQKITEIIKGFSSMSDTSKKVILIVLALIAAIAPVASIIGGISTIIGGITAVIGVISGAIGLLTGTLAVATPAATALAGAITFITGPIGLTIIFITALVAGFVYLWNHCEGFRKFWIDLWNNIKSITGSVVNYLVGFFTVTIPNAWKSVVTFFQSVPGWFKNLWEGIKTTTVSVWNGILNFFTSVWESIKTIAFSFINGLVSVFVSKFDWLINGVMEIFNGLELYFTGLWEVIKTVFLGGILLVIDLVTGNFSKLSQDAQGIWNNLKNAFGLIWEGIKLIFSGALDIIKGYLLTVFNGIVSIGMSIWEGFKAFMSSLWEGIKNIAISAWNGLSNTVTNLIRGIVNGAISIWNGLLNWFAELPSRLYSLGVNMFNSMKNGIINTISGIKSAVVSGINDAINFITDLPNRAVEWGKDFIDGLIRGIKGMVGKVGDTVEGVANKIRSFLHFSVPDEGPLTDYESWMPDFMSGLAQGIEKSKKLVTQSIKGLSSDMSIGVTGGLNPQSLSRKPITQSYSKENNLTQNITINSPKALSASEVARHTRRAQQELGLNL